MGRSFWLRTTAPLTVAVAGLPAPAEDFALEVVPGWNMLGNPFTEQVTFGTAEVTTGGTTYDLDTSNLHGYTANYAWAYDNIGRSYRLISEVLPFAARTIREGQGVFFRSRVIGQLTLKRPTGALNVAKEQEPAAPPTEDNWTLRLAAEASGLADRDNFMGVSPQAAELNEVISPPIPEAGVELCFTSTQAEGAAATSFVAPEVEKPTWEISVANAQPSSEVKLSWPDLTTLPNSVRPILTDLATGRSVYMRTTSSYGYQAGSQPRQFQISLAEDSVVMLTSVTAIPAGQGAEIVYALAAPAQVTVEVLNIAGRTVRVVNAGQLAPTGLNTVTWDGRNASGARVPGGIYLVRVTAQSDIGQRAAVLRSLSLNR